MASRRDRTNAGDQTVPGGRRGLAGRAGLALGAWLAAMALPQAQAAIVSLYAFSGGSDGAAPQGALIADSGGNLYGTTSTGGANNAGTVFRLSPPATSGGAWTKTVLYDFDPASTIGSVPLGGVVRDSAGALYGTASAGGAGTKPGTVFKLTPPASGATAWTATVLASGLGTPSGPLLRDSAGNFYGTTETGGANGAGTVYKLTAPTTVRGAWKVSTLRAFNFTGTAGAVPVGGVIADSSGNLYGATRKGGGSSATQCIGIGGCGVLFRLAPPAAGSTSWTATLLRKFGTTATDAITPSGGLTQDSAGNLYGVTSAGGANGTGTAFKLAVPAAGKTAWVLSLLRSFDPSGSDGTAPAGGLIRDTAGNVYGATAANGTSGLGGIFALKPPTGTSKIWTETIACPFWGLNGAGPASSLIADSYGYLYGTTASGGTGFGNVFAYLSNTCPQPVALTAANGYRTDSFTLSNNNLTASGSPGGDYAQIATNRGHNSGKWYFTVTVNSHDGTARHELGIIRQDSVGISLASNQSETADFHNSYGFIGSSSNFVYYPVPTIDTGTTAIFKFDFDGGIWTIETGGTVYGPWPIGGPAIARDPVTNLFPVMLPYFGLGGGDESVTFSFGGATTADGFAPWDDSGAAPASTSAVHP